MSFETVLVPLDGSELSDRVLGHVEALLDRAPRHVVLLRALAPGIELDGEIPGQLELERTAADAHLDAARRRLERAGARVTTVLREGDPAAEVLFATEDWSPDLVAMSTHGRSGVPRLLLGSVAERVLRVCTVPMLLVTPRTEGPPRPPRPRRVLVPLDGSDLSASILPCVEEVAGLETEVLLLHVRPVGPPPVLAVVLGPSPAPEALAAARIRLATRGLPVRVVGAHGAPATEILEAADREQVDLIAMATRGRTGAARVLAGSVAETVLRRARQPLLLVRAPEAFLG